MGLPSDVRSTSGLMSAMSSSELTTRPSEKHTTEASACRGVGSKTTR